MGNRKEILISLTFRMLAFRIQYYAESPMKQSRGNSFTFPEGRRDTLKTKSTAGYRIPS